MGLSVWQIAIIAVVVLVLFGRGRISAAQIDAPGNVATASETTSSETSDAAKS